MQGGLWQVTATFQQSMSGQITVSVVSLSVLKYYPEIWITQVTIRILMKVNDLAWERLPSDGMHG